MTYDYPPETPATLQAVAWHVALLALALASGAGLLIRRRQPARWWDVWVWALVSLVAAVLCLAGTSVSRAEYRPFLLGYLAFVWLVSGTAGLMSVRSMFRHGQGIACVYSLSALVGLGMLILFLLPSVPSAREAAFRMQCKNNLKQILFGLHAWEAQYGRLPAPTESGDEPDVSWRVRLLPYLEAAHLVNRYDRTAAWDAPVNLPLARLRVSHYQCPSNPHGADEQERIYTAYALVQGPGTAFPPQRSLALNEITDGQGHTLLVAESCGQNIVWTEPRDVDVARHPLAVNASGPQPRTSSGILSSYHPNGALMALADGRVTFVPKNIDPEVLRALTTAAAGDDAGFIR